MSEEKVIGLVISITIGLIAVIVVGKLLIQYSSAVRGLIGLVFKFMGLIILAQLLDKFTGVYQKHPVWVWVVIGIIMLIFVIKWINAIIDDVVAMKNHIETRKFVRSIVKKGRKREEEKLNRAKETMREYEKNQYKMR